MITTLANGFVERGLIAFPGFELIARIGLGGYGEVWKARSADGQLKAIKCVYGSIDEQRAARELKSLGRIRAVRHPYLLAIEQVEIVDGQLFILTELADNCLQDVYEQYRQAGQPGIPREELLAYLREAAETLDYLYEQHSLQHLDVKPGNLLVLNGSVKVADFGLLKDLQDSGASLVNGLTPTYAAPEVFNGRPSRYSDQYSLAIVYQELLTGTLPFDGVSAAQLASQHLHSTPDLAGLLPHDRFAIGKALTKDPARRFRSCGELMERLVRGGSSAMIVNSGAVAASGAATTVGRQRKSVTAGDAPWRHDGRTVVVSKPEVVDLPAPVVDFAATTYRPTLFIGLGGLSGQILRRLRRQLDDQFDSREVPAFGFLFIDTDVDAINMATAEEMDGRLQEDEVLLLPLRKAQEYRERSFAVSPSLSRRWIYNMPRSLRTEGLRALGRIALLDHAQRVLDRLRSKLAVVTSAESLAASSQKSGLNFASYDPQVYVVSSITGGTGGGMVLDIGYAVRQVLAEMGLSDESVLGILPLLAQNGAKGRQLCVSNAYACLSELQHFSSGSCDYPGETACGLAGFRENRSVFARTYLIDCGTELTEDKLAGTTQRIAEYLYLASSTPVKSFLEACREQQPEDASSGCSQVRTFGVATLGHSAEAIPREQIDTLCQAVIRKWRGGVDNAGSDEPIKLVDLDRLYDQPDRAGQVSQHLEQMVVDKLGQLDVSAETLQRRLAQSATVALGRERSAFFSKLIHHTLSNARPESTPHDTLMETIKVIRLVIGSSEIAEDKHQNQIEALLEVLIAEARRQASDVGAALRMWVLGLVDAAATRLAGARQTILALHRQIQLIRDEAARLASASRFELTRFEQEVAALRQNTKFNRQTGFEQAIPYAQKFASLAVDDVVTQALAVSSAAIEAHLSQVADELRDLWSNLNQLALQFRTGKLDPAAGDEALQANQALVIEQMEHLLETQFFHGQYSLRKALTEDRESRDTLIGHMRAAARKALLARHKRQALDDLLAKPGQPPAQGMRQSLVESHRAATPGLLDVGGTQRFLLLVPDQVDRRLVEQEAARITSQPPTILPAADGEFRLVCEAQQLPLDGILGTLLRLSPDCRELASRLHTRVDIDW